MELRRRVRRQLFAGSASMVALLALIPAAAQARRVFVTNYGSDSVSVIETATNAVVATVPLGTDTNPGGVAITPDGTRAYVAEDGSDDVRVISTATNTVVGSPIPVGSEPRMLAIAPDGSRAYVANGLSASVSVIDTATNGVIATIGVGSIPLFVALAPDGKRAYVTNQNDGTLSVIDTAANGIVGSPIPVGGQPRGIAVTPTGNLAYVANQATANVTAVDLSTGAPVATVPVGNGPNYLAVTPDGKRVYVANQNDNTVSVIDTQTNTVAGPPIAVGAYPRGVAITPDGSRAYVTNQDDGTVSVIDTSTNAVLGAAIAVGMGPPAVAIVPDQAPTAAAAAQVGGGVRTVNFDASASSDPDGNVASFSWFYGDGESSLGVGNPFAAHTYASPGVYTAALQVTDNEGCSVFTVYTGQTASCSGSAAAVAAVGPLDLAPPTLKLRGRKRQSGSAVTIRVGCDQDCSIVLRGKLRRGRMKANLRTARISLGAGQSKNIKLRLTRRARNIGGGRVTVTAKAADQSGNESTATTRLRFR